MLQCMGSERVGHDLMTEQQQQHRLNVMLSFYESLGDESGQQSTGRVASSKAMRSN